MSATSATTKPWTGRYSLRLWGCTAVAASALIGCSLPGPAHDHGAAGSDTSAYPEAVYRQVSATFAPDGTLWRVTPGKKHVYVDHSDDQGRHFGSPVSVGSQSQRIKSSGENRPGIAVDATGKVYVIYTAEGEQPATVYYSVSSDHGQHFSEPAPVSTSAGEANTYLGKLRLDRNGIPYVFWHDERERTDWKAAGNAIYFTTLSPRSGQPDKASRTAESLCDCCGIAADFENGTRPVFVTRFVYAGGVRDHGLVKRAEDGKGWDTWRVTFDDWKVDACPEHGPALAIAGDGRYHMSWFSQGDAHKGLFYAYSTDHGHQFSRPLPIGSVQALAGHPDILAQNGRVTLTWQEFDGARTRIMTMSSADAGEHWSQAAHVADTAGDADLPFLLSDGRTTYLSWNTLDEGYRLIPLQ